MINTAVETEGLIREFHLNVRHYVMEEVLHGYDARGKTCHEVVDFVLERVTKWKGRVRKATGTFNNAWEHSWLVFVDGGKDQEMILDVYPWASPGIPLLVSTGLGSPWRGLYREDITPKVRDLSRQLLEAVRELEVYREEEKQRAKRVTTLREMFSGIADNLEHLR